MIIYLISTFNIINTTGISKKSPTYEQQTLKQTKENQTLTMDPKTSTENPFVSMIYTIIIVCFISFMVFVPFYFVYSILKCCIFVIKSICGYNDHKRQYHIPRYTKSFNTKERNPNIIKHKVIRESAQECEEKASKYQNSNDHWNAAFYLELASDEYKESGNMIKCAERLEESGLEYFQYAKEKGEDGYPWIANDKYEKAAECYEKAANIYRELNKIAEALEVYKNAVGAYILCKNHYKVEEINLEIDSLKSGNK